MELKTTSKCFYVYVLQSEKDHQFYTGYSSKLKQRLEQHKNGQVNSTKHRLPVKLIYWEVCLCQQDATKREKYLKTSWRKRYIKNRLRNYLTGSSSKTTGIYTHVSRQHIGQISSPLETAMGKSPRDKFIP